MTVSHTCSALVKVSLNLQTDEDVRGVDLERRFSNDGAADIHERVQEVAQRRGSFFERNDERIALEMFIRQVKEGDNTVYTTIRKRK